MRIEIYLIKIKSIYFDNVPHIKKEMKYSEISTSSSPLYIDTVPNDDLIWNRYNWVGFQKAPCCY